MKICQFLIIPENNKKSLTSKTLIKFILLWPPEIPHQILKQSFFWEFFTWCFKKKPNVFMAQCFRIQCFYDPMFHQLFLSMKHWIKNRLQTFSRLARQAFQSFISSRTRQSLEFKFHSSHGTFFPHVRRNIENKFHFNYYCVCVNTKCEYKRVNIKKTCFLHP